MVLKILVTTWQTMLLGGLNSSLSAAVLVKWTRREIHQSFSIGMKDSPQHTQCVSNRLLKIAREYHEIFTAGVMDDVFDATTIRTFTSMHFSPTT